MPRSSPLQTLEWRLDHPEFLCCTSRNSKLRPDNAQCGRFLKMGIWRHICAFLAFTGAFTLCSAAHAGDQDANAYHIDFAEKMVQLDAMMFVTDRVCLLKKQSLGSAYLAALNSVRDIVKSSDKYLEKRYHDFHKDSNYDKMIVATLNTYGQGHTSFDCNKLADHLSELSTFQDNQEIYKKASFLLQEAPNHGHLPGRRGEASALEPNALPSDQIEETPKMGEAARPTNTLPDLNAKAPMKAEPSSGSSTLEKAKTQWLRETQNYTGGVFIKDF